METNELKGLLKETKYEKFSGSVFPMELKEYVYNDLFKCGNDNTGYFVLKIRNKNQKNVFDSINRLNSINDQEKFIHKYTDIIEKNGFLIMAFDWIKGFQPIDNNRKYLPMFFAKLAKFNKGNIVKSYFTSMYVDGNYFNTIGELIEFEINSHRNYLIDIIDIKLIMEILSVLKQGMATVILEDMNTGNLFVTDKGEYKFIDTDWIINGLNLYQFEKIDYFGFDERQWYNVNEEAKECYIAYFETLGIKFSEANEQIRAFELLQVIRKNSFIKCLGKDDDDETNRRIKIVIEKDKYI